MTARATVIANASAGSGCDPAWAREVTERFRALDVDADVVLAGDVDAAVRRIPDAAQTVIAAGGDGTINAVASALVGTSRRLGVLPVGTLNHFARDLDIPLALDAAVQTIASGHTTQVDVGQVNDRYFLNNSSIGIYPAVVRRREQRRRQGWPKWSALAWASLKVLRLHPFLDVELCANGTRRRLRAPFVFVGNNVYRMDGFNAGSRDALDRGTLSVYTTSRSTRLGLVALAFHALLGRVHEARDFAADTATELVIATRHGVANVAMDGEIAVLRTPLAYRILPRALTVLVPAGVRDA